MIKFLACRTGLFDENIQEMAKRSSTSYLVEVKSLSFLRSKLHDVEILIFRILTKFAFRRYITCMGLNYEV